MISWEEKYRILRVAAILAVEDIKCGYPQKAVVRLNTTVKALDLKTLYRSEPPKQEP